MVSITDVTFLVNNILGIANLGEDEHSYIYDVNGDGKVAIVDVTFLVNNILGVPNPGEKICPDDQHPHLIDLGLPSGTLWSCCNVGAVKPEAYGGYYAWGETEEKSYYHSSTYQYFHEGSFVDIGNEIAGTQYDVARVKGGNLWRMPCQEQIEELIDNCQSEWTTENGVGGWLFIGSNGSSIFLPAAGHRWEGNINYAGSYGEYWSSTQYPSISNHAYELSFYSDRVTRTSCYYCYGNTVRPVAASLELSTTFLLVCLGHTTEVEITQGSGNYELASNDEAVATAVIEGDKVKVTGQGLGQAVVTVTDTKTGKTASVEVAVSLHQAYLTCPDDNHPHKICLGLPSGTLWSCCNVDADKPEAYGGYYAWGETNEKKYYLEENYKHYQDESYVNIGNDIAGSEYDVARVKWGEDWQMPSIDQFQELLHCAYESTTLNGVNGMCFTGRNGASIFLPAAGSRYDDYGLYIGEEGNYWSSTLFTYKHSARVFFFDSDTGNCNNYLERFHGNSVRPVSK